MSAKETIAKRAARFLENGDIVNLGIGIPTLVADFIAPHLSVFLHTENGILGVGPTPLDEPDPNLVNAGKLPVTVMTGASYFDSASSFAMIRGGHIDISILGVLQMDEMGRIANWAIPGKAVLGVGGAMDLLEGSKRIIVTTLHTTKAGKPKLVKNLNYPLTSERRVDFIITELAVFAVDDRGLILVETAPGITVETVKEKTEADFRIQLNSEFVGFDM